MIKSKRERIMKKIIGGAGLLRLKKIKEGESILEKKKSQALKYKIQFGIRELYDKHKKEKRKPPTNKEIINVRNKIKKNGVTHKEIESVMSFGFKARGVTKRKKTKRKKTKRKKTKRKKTKHEKSKRKKTKRKKSKRKKTKH